MVQNAAPKTKYASINKLAIVFLLKQWSFQHLALIIKSFVQITLITVATSVADLMKFALTNLEEYVPTLTQGFVAQQKLSATLSAATGPLIFVDTENVTVKNHNVSCLTLLVGSFAVITIRLVLMVTVTMLHYKIQHLLRVPMSYVEDIVAISKNTVPMVSVIQEKNMPFVKNPVTNVLPTVVIHTSNASMEFALALDPIRSTSVQILSHIAMDSVAREMRFAIGGFVST